MNTVPLTSKAEREAGNPSSLNTVLHTALLGGCSADIVQRMKDTEGGVYLSLKNRDGKTPHDIAKEKGMGKEMLKLLEVPKSVTDNLETIDTIEKALHKVIMGRAETLITENGVELPQVAPMFEKPDELSSFHYSIPGFYGGFNFHLDIDKCVLTTDSFIRVCGGSEETHVINRKGKVKMYRMYSKSKCFGCC